MRLVLAPQGIDHVAERGERLVDVLRFFQSISSGVRLIFFEKKEEGGKEGEYGV